MSGGFFDYRDWHLQDMAEQIDEVIEQNDSTERDEWDWEIGRHYSPEVVEKLSEASKQLRIARIYAHRVDYLLSGDDGEESFLRRLEEELNEVT